jgi:GMP synthase (glutamine-hydrolysing)
MKPFLLLAIREDEAAAENEYAAFLQFSGLDEGHLHRVRLEQRPLGPLNLDDYAGIMLGGGPFNSSDPEPRKTPVQRRVEADVSALLDRVVAQDFPFLGACYGVGTLGTHQGAVVDATYAEPIGPVSISLTASGRGDPLFSALPDVFEAFVGHKEAIRELPPHAVHLASSPLCPVQAFRFGANVYATQFHPELDLQGLCTRIEVYKYSGYFEPHEADSLKEMAKQSSVVHPPALLRRFAERYGTALRPVTSRKAEPALGREPGRRL